MASCTPSVLRGLPLALCQTVRAAPSAPPASPLAGWIQRWSKTFSRRSRPFATQLSATPPAMQQLSQPVTSRACRAILRTMSSVTTWIDAARSISRCVISLSGLRAGPPKSLAKRSLVMRRPSA